MPDSDCKEGCLEKPECLEEKHKKLESEELRPAGIPEKIQVLSCSDLQIQAPAPPAPAEPKRIVGPQAFPPEAEELSRFQALLSLSVRPSMAGRAEGQEAEEGQER